MTRCAIQLISFFGFEVGGMIELEIRVLPGSHMVCNQSPILRESRVFDLLRLMAAAAIGAG